MSAITYHLEQEFEITPEELDRAACAGAPADLEGFLEARGKKKKCPTTLDRLEASHRGLHGMLWVREAANQVLEGRHGNEPFTFHLQYGKPTASGKLSSRNQPFLVLNRPLGGEPAWWPAGAPTIRAFKVLTWTSKMNCPSWSIPSGHMSIGGTCPAAVQSAVPKNKLEAVLKKVRQMERRTVMADMVCQYCYASKGNYSNSTVQFAQALRYMWAKQAMITDNPATGRTVFVDSMVEIVKNANYVLDGRSKPDGDSESGRKVTLVPEPDGQKYFRIHDSGDMFSAAYLRQWKQIADLLPDITFWAPTRIWALPGGIELVSEVNAEPRNLIIRPSSYHTGSPGPRIDAPGWASPTTVIHKDQNKGMRAGREAYARFKGERAPGGPDTRYTVECDAYAGSSNKTCRNAVDPVASEEEGRQVVGCRVCWRRADEVINYPMH